METAQKVIPMTWLAVGLAAAALVAGVYAISLRPEPTTVAASADRTVHMLAVEYKGTAGAGEKLAEGEKVNAYTWQPASLTVNQGDHVTLVIYGVNGGAHPTTIDGYDDLTFTVRDANGNVIEQGSGSTFNVYRGHTTAVTFTADDAGAFDIACATHQPTMTGTLFVNT